MRQGPLLSTPRHRTLVETMLGGEPAMRRLRCPDGLSCADRGLSGKYIKYLRTAQPELLRPQIILPWPLPLFTFCRPGV
jgi:hypothetical protein